MIFHKQTGKRNCGQIAVASLTDNTVETIENLVGHSHSTKTKELAKVLRSLGYPCADRCLPIRAFTEWPPYSLAQIRVPRRSGWHWIAIGEGKVYDGHELEALPLLDYIDGLLHATRNGELGYKLTSLLPVIYL